MVINSLNCGRALQVAGTAIRVAGPLVKLGLKVATAALPAWMVFKLRTSVVVPKVELSWCQVAEKAFTASCQKRGFDAVALREKGKALLTKFGTSLPELNAQVNRSSEEGKAYVDRLVAKKERPSIEEYVEGQLKNGYFDRLDVKTLGRVFGDQRDLSDGEARELYKKLDSQIRVALKSNVLSTKDCLVQAAIASETRDNARTYTRIRLNNLGRAEMAEMRNDCEYGTPSPDAEYMFGRKARETKQETCDAIIKSSQKTNRLYNLASKFWPCD